MFTIVVSIPPLLPTDPPPKNPKDKLDILAQLIRQTCPLPKCSSSLTQSTALNLQNDCSQDLLQQNVMATLNWLLFSHYKPIQELICKRNSRSEFNSYCILETLINVGSYQADSTTSLDENENHHLDKKQEKDSIKVPKKKSHTYSISKEEELPSTTTTFTPTTLEETSEEIPDSTTTSEDFPDSTITSTTNLKTSTITSAPPPTATTEKGSPPTTPQDNPSFLKTLKSLPDSIICTDCNKV